MMMKNEIKDLAVRIDELRDLKIKTEKLQVLIQKDLDKHLNKVCALSGDQFEEYVYHMVKIVNNKNPLN